MVPQLVNTGFQVLFHSPPGVLFTFPSQYYALSVTKEYLALGGGPPSFPQDSTCLVVLRVLLASLPIPLTGLSPCLVGLPSSILLCSAKAFLQPLTPPCSHGGLGSFLFARRYYGNHGCFLFLRLLRCFSSPGSPRGAIRDFHPSLPRGAWDLPMRVSPFRYPRIVGYLLLPAAFRSLSRLSSALSAKASTLCSFLLNLSLPHGPSVALGEVFFFLLCACTVPRTDTLGCLS